MISADPNSGGTQHNPPQSITTHKSASSLLFQSIPSNSAAMSTPISFYCILLIVSIAWLIHAGVVDENWDPNLRLTLIPLEPFFEGWSKYGDYNGSRVQQRKRHNLCTEEENRAEWEPTGEWTQCSDSCGGCGRRTRPRRCRRRRSECPCEGSEREEQLCNVQVCIYPRQPTCCAPLVPASIEGNFSCALPPNPRAEKKPTGISGEEKEEGKQNKINLPVS